MKIYKVAQNQKVGLDLVNLKSLGLYFNREMKHFESTIAMLKEDETRNEEERSSEFTTEEIQMILQKVGSLINSNELTITLPYDVVLSPKEVLALASIYVDFRKESEAEIKQYAMMALVRVVKERMEEFFPKYLQELKQSAG